jgi:hypothetical protein
MTSRKASVLVADEVLFSLTGKANLLGIYTTDIGVVAPSAANQLVFFFTIETGIDEPFRSLLLEVKLPESEPVRLPVTLTATIPTAGKTTTIYRWPLLVQAPTLRPGPIEVKVIHERGEISVAAPWIVMTSPPITKPN